MEEKYGSTEIALTYSSGEYFGGTSASSWDVYLVTSSHFPAFYSLLTPIGHRPEWKRNIAPILAMAEFVVLLSKKK